MAVAGAGHNKLTNLTLITMKSGQHQTMKMQQKLSPQQLLLLQLIQMPVTELEQRLKEEVEKNPVLEVSSSANDMMEPLPETGTDAGEDPYEYRDRLGGGKYREQVERARRVVGISGIVFLPEAVIPAVEQRVAGQELISERDKERSVLVVAVYRQHRMCAERIALRYRQR